MDDWTLIYMAFLPAPEPEGPYLSATEVLDLAKNHPDEKVRRLAQEAVFRRWHACDDSQGGD